MAHSSESVTVGTVPDDPSRLSRDSRTDELAGRPERPRGPVPKGERPKPVRFVPARSRSWGDQKLVYTCRIQRTAPGRPVRAPSRERSGAPGAEPGTGQGKPPGYSERLAVTERRSG